MKRIFPILILAIVCSTNIAFSQNAQKEATVQQSKNKRDRQSILEELSTARTMDNSAVFSLVINRGEVFSVNAPGQLTSVTFSGFERVDPLGKRLSPGAINNYNSKNGLTLYGNTLINDYATVPSDVITCSALFDVITAPQGLILTLEIDGRSLSVQLPFVSTDKTWKGGYRYIYVVTVTGSTLSITGVAAQKLH